MAKLRPTCLSVSPGVCSNSWPLSWWYYLTISILCHHLLLFPLIFSSINRVFSNESAFRLRWPKYWTFSFSISPSNEYSGFISCRIDWFGSLAVQGTLKHQFFSAQLSLCFNSHIHTWLLKKKIALTIRTLVSKVMSLFFNMLCRFIIAFLPRSKHF